MLFSGFKSEFWEFYGIFRNLVSGYFVFSGYFLGFLQVDRDQDEH